MHACGGKIMYVFTRSPCVVGPRKKQADAAYSLLPAAYFLDNKKQISFSHKEKNVGSACHGLSYVFQFHLVTTEVVSHRLDLYYTSTEEGVV